MRYQRRRLARVLSLPHAQPAAGQPFLGADLKCSESEAGGGLALNLRDRDRHGDGVDPQGNGDGRDPLGWDDTLGADGFLPF
jgi:hypothetical protein